MTTFTRVQKIQQTDYYKSGEWFTASQLAQSVSVPVDDLRTVMAQNKELFDCKRVSGKALVYRKIKPRDTLVMRTKRFDFEGEHTPRFY